MYLWLHICIISDVHDYIYISNMLRLHDNIYISFYVSISEIQCYSHGKKNSSPTSSRRIIMKKIGSGRWNCTRPWMELAWLPCSPMCTFPNYSNVLNAQSISDIKRIITCADFVTSSLIYELYRVLLNRISLHQGYEMNGV